ncbi:hypothetical protein DXG03_004031 [Asterophora parasitica]|uniref:Uncharacterized protein n=1 Tax=Asterophora parasitica TaxID=117018 RepID=A0A9P7GBC6_9AGAR|nr:hypothetical protein DXG03_004031 [Asterophora parasitica]
MLPIEHEGTPQRNSSDPPLLNIQFHIESVQGLPLASHSKLTPRSVYKRSVHASCSGAHVIHCQTDAVPEGQPWYENTAQMGPIVGTDKIKFHVERHTPWALKRRGSTIASSIEYTVDSLRVMQGKQPDRKSISIPLHSEHDSRIEATLHLRMQEPTAEFISKQWILEARLLEQKMALVAGKQLVQAH